MPWDHEDFARWKAQIEDLQSSLSGQPSREVSRRIKRRAGRAENILRAVLKIMEEDPEDLSDSHMPRYIASKISMGVGNFGIDAEVNREPLGKEYFFLD